MRMTLCLWEDDESEHALFLRGWVVVRFTVSPNSLEYPCRHQCLHCHGWWLSHGYAESDLHWGFPWRVGREVLMKNSRKAVKDEKIKSAALSALVSADPPWESLWDHNTSHKTAGARPAVWKGPASLRERAVNWRRDRVEGREKFLVHTGWMRVLVVKPIELEREWWSGSWYVGTEKGGGLVGHYMKPKYNSSLSFSHSWSFMSLLCLPQAPYGFS